MTRTSIPGGTIHTLPADMRGALASSAPALAAWRNLTPLARNEWICWVISVKKEETRKVHRARLVEDLRNGKRRPCCWIGCIHRTDKPVSPSVRGVLAKRLGKKGE